MLPILPALLLLLMHGPSNLERLARDGRLPVRPEALRRDVAAVNSPVRCRNQAAFAAMLTAHDPCFAQALFDLLQPVEEEPTAARPVPTTRITIPAEHPQEPLADGFAEGRRSRDGPRVLA